MRSSVGWVLAGVIVVGCSSSGGDATPAQQGGELDASVDPPQGDGGVSDDTDAGNDPVTDGGSGDGGGTSDAGDGGSPPSAGCTTGTGLPEGAATLTVGGKTRSYVLRKPTGGAAGKAWPLVLALHPNGSNAGYFDVMTGGRAVRPIVSDKAILVLPEADDGDWRGDLVGELAYFEALLMTLKGALCIDTGRIFSMGFSGGGSFSGMLGCNRTDIRAIASGGAVIYFDPTKCVGKPAAWVTIGDGEAVPGRIAFRDFWRTDASCTTTTTAVGPAATCAAYTCPNPARPVHFCSHAGGHEWPSFGATAAWGFFSKL